MQIVIFKKDFKQYVGGIPYVLSNNEAFGHIDCDKAILQKNYKKKRRQRKKKFQYPDKELHPGKSKYYKTK